MSQIDQSVVSIRFSGKGLDPKRLGEILGWIETSDTESTIKTLKSGRVVWSIRYGENENVSLEQKLEALLAKFTSDIAIWQQIPQNVKTDIFCGLFLGGWNEGFELTPRIMKELADRNLRIGFDVYAPTDSWYA